MPPHELSLIAHDGEQPVMEQHWHGKTFYSYSLRTNLCIKSGAKNPLMPVFRERIFRTRIFAPRVGDARSTMFNHQKNVCNRSRDGWA
jgi:hypothetical protein